MIGRVEAATAILLRKIRFTETSLIVTWLSQKHGRVKTVAKGARGQKSRFAGTTDLFFQCDIQFTLSSKSDLHTLREAALREPFPGLRAEYGRLLLAGYFVELLELVTEAEHPAPELYDLLLRALKHLNEKAASPRAMEHFESELSRLLGIQQAGVSGANSIARTYLHLPPARRKLTQHFADRSAEA